MIKNSRIIVLAMIFIVTGYLFYGQKKTPTFFDGQLGSSQKINLEIKSSFSSLRGIYQIDEGSLIAFDGVKKRDGSISFFAKEGVDKESSFFEGKLKENKFKTRGERALVLEGRLRQDGKDSSVYVMESSKADSILYQNHYVDPFVFYSLLDFSPYLKNKKGASILDLSSHKVSSVYDEEAKNAFFNQGFISKSIESEKEMMGYQSKRIKDSLYAVRGYYAAQNSVLDFLLVLSYDGIHLKKIFQAPVGYKAFGRIESFSVEKGDVHYSISVTPHGLLELILEQSEEALPNCGVCYFGTVEKTFNTNSKVDRLDGFRLLEKRSDFVGEDFKSDQVYEKFTQLLEGLSPRGKKIPWQKMMGLREELKRLL